jgi:putative ABC transport system permease protein
MLLLILADLKRHWPGVAAVVLIVALAGALGTALTLSERALRLGSARAADAFDLVVGAPGSETQLVLSAVFLQPAPLVLADGGVLPALLRDERVRWAAPVGFGDFVESFPIVGTTQALVDGLGGVAEGRSFARLGEAVLGAAVPRSLGSRFHPAHGEPGAAAGIHNEATYTAVGRLKPTGTAWDRAVIVPVEAVWRIHEPHHEAAASPLLNGAAEHADELGFDRPIRPEAALDASSPGVPAIIVKPRSIADAYRLRQSYRNERTLAVFPGEVLTRLYGTLGDAKRVLSAVAVGAQALVAASVLLVIVIHVAQRRRQIGALRALGAPRRAVFALVWIESFAIAAAGLLLGFAIGFFAASLLAAAFASASGIAASVGFAREDWLSLALLLLAVGVFSLLPALLAYRQSPAQALRG